MRVAYITSQADVSAGWGRYSVEVIKGVREKGIEPVLITPPGVKLDAAIADVERHEILPRILIPRLRTPRSLLTAPKLHQILKTCDVVQCLVELYAPLVALACPRDVPFLLNAHGTWAVRPLESRFQRLFFAPAIRRADAVICLSRFTYDWMTRLMPIPQAVIISGGVTLEHYQREVDVTLPEWVNDAKILLTVGAFKERKGQQISLEAFALAKEHIPNLHYVFASPYNPDAPYFAHLMQRVHDLGLADYVHFLGLVSQDELVAWYKAADVFVLTQVNDGSSFEGLGLVYLEAGAVGTPSIGSLNCGAEDAIIPGESGLLVSQNDSQSTADAIIKMLSDDALYAKLSAGATQQAEKLSWENLITQTIDVYHTTLKQKRRS